MLFIKRDSLRFPLICSPKGGSGTGSKHLCGHSTLKEQYCAAKLGTEHVQLVNFTNLVLPSSVLRRGEI